MPRCCKSCFRVCYAKQAKIDVSNTAMCRRSNRRFDTTRYYDIHVRSKAEKYPAEFPVRHHKLKIYKIRTKKETVEKVINRDS